MADKKILFFAWGLFFCLGVPFLSAEETVSKEAAATQAVVAHLQAVKTDLEKMSNAGGSAEAAPSETGNAETAQEEVRDPFQAQLKAEPEEAAVLKTENAVKVTLEGLGAGSQRAYAVLNGDIYLIDEEKKGIKLLAVRKGEADISVNGAVQTLRLLDDQAWKKTQEGRRNPNNPSTS